MNNNNHLYEMALGNILSKVLTLAAKLDLDLYLTKPQNVNILIQELKCHPIAFKKFLRVLDSHGVVQFDGELVSPTELTPTLIQLKTPHMIDSYRAIDDLEFSLQTNKNCWAKTYG